MNAFDYLQHVRDHNCELFENHTDKKVQMKVSALEKVIVDAFEAGKSCGLDEGKNSKSLFEQIFGI